MAQRGELAHTSICIRICICESRGCSKGRLARARCYSIPNANDLDRRAALWLGDDVAPLLVDFVRAVVLVVAVEFELELRTEQSTKP